MNSPGVALASAVSWGTSDFLGGLSARRISPYQTVAIAHALSLAATLAVIVWSRLPPASHATAELGLTAGLFGGGGLVLFYEALALGSMGLTAALAGVLTATVPVLYGLSTEGLPTTRQLLGFAVAIAAIWLIAAAPRQGRLNRRSLWFGAIAGTCFGIYFVQLKLASAHGNSGGAISAVLWPMAFSRVTSTALASLLCLWAALRSKTATPGIWGWKTLWIAAAVGVMDSGGNMLFMMAARSGRLDIAAVLSSLYPAVTILLAAWVLKERTTRSQALGMALALGAVGLIAS